MGTKVPGPDPSDDLHVTPFGFLKRFLGWTTEIDWASQLTNGVTAVTSAAAASKTVAGIVQFATKAQATLGNNDTLAVTPLGVAGALQAGAQRGPGAIPVIYEPFNVADAGAWPSSWTVRANTGTGTTVANVLSGLGRLVPGATALQGVRASQETMAAVGECGIRATFRFVASTDAYAALFINGSGTGTGTYGYYIAPDNSYSVEMTASSIAFYKMSGAGTGTVILSAPTLFQPDVDYDVRFERIGNVLRAKQWVTGAVEPADWTLSTVLTDAVPYTGFAGVGAQNGNAGNRIVSFTNISIYQLRERIATNTMPGLGRLATTAEAQAASDSSVLLTPATALAEVKANVLNTFSSLSALFADTSLQDGALATVTRYATGTNLYHRSSTWQRANGYWSPIGQTILVEAADISGALSVLNTLSGNVTSNNTKAYLPPDTLGTLINTGEQFVWNGSAWAIYRRNQNNTYYVASLGTGNIQVAALYSLANLVNVHLIAPNYDKWFLLWVIINPYNGNAGQINVLSTWTITNTPGYSDPSWNVSNYNLWAYVSNAGSGTSPISSHATTTFIGVNTAYATNYTI